MLRGILITFFASSALAQYVISPRDTELPWTLINSEILTPKITEFPLSWTLGDRVHSEDMILPPKLTELPLSWTLKDKINPESQVLSQKWMKIIKDTMQLNDVDKLMTRAKPVDDWKVIDLKSEEKKKQELCLKFGIGCFDVIRMDEKKDENRRKEESINEMIMRDELCKKMGMDCRKSEMCEKMGVMCTKEEMCKKMGMDCSKKDMCELMGVDCKREDMCEKMGVMCTLEDMCRKKGIGCSKAVLFKTSMPVKGDLMWVKDEFNRPVLMDADGRRFSQISNW